MKEETIVKKIDKFAYDYEAEKVPEGRLRPWWDICLVWTGLWTSGFAVLNGILYAGSGLPLKTILEFTITGNAIVWALYTLNGIIGVKERVSAPFIAKMPLGDIGADILAAVGCFVTIGFGGLGIQMLAQGISVVTGWSIYITAWIAVLCILVTALAGYKTLSVLSKMVLPAFLIILPIICIAAMKGLNEPIWGIQRPYGAPFTFWSGVTYVIGMSITAAMLTPNISRYAKKESHVIPAAGIGAFYVGVFLSVICGVLAVYANSGDVFTVLVTPAFVVGTILFIGLVWTTADNDYYHGGLMAVKIYQKIPKWIYTLTFGLITIVFIYANMLSKIVSWCSLLAIVIPPYIGLILSDYYLLPRLGIECGLAVKRKEKVNWVGIMAWAGGIAMAEYITLTIGILPSVIGMLVGGAIYIIGMEIKVRVIKGGR
jgi:cytosine permease